MRFEPFADDVRADPYPHYAQLRAEDPVHWSEKLRAWAVFRYDDVTAVLGNDTRFSADRGRARRGEQAFAADRAVGLRIVSADPPVCTVPRAVLNGCLVARVRALRPRIDAIVAELLDAMATADGADLVEAFAYPLPIRVIAELLDIPEADRPRFQRLSHAIARGMDRLYGSPEVASGLQEIGAYFVELVVARKTSAGDDLVRRLLAAEHHGERLNDLEVVALCTALVFGGHETTVSLLAGGTLALLRHPDQLARMREDPGRAATAVEELLRYDSPPQFVSRVVRVDSELRGRHLRAGDALLVGIAAANRDPAVFADADVLDVGRTPNPHVAFGLGTHTCPGAQLTRLEGRIAIPALLARFPRLRLDGEPEWRDTFILRGLDRLPVRLR